MKLSDSVSAIPGVGEAYQKRLSKLKISTVSDLINHFPSRYLDYSKTTPIDSLEPNDDVCIKATVDSISSVRLRSRKTMQKATISDPSGSIELTWFNQPYLKDSLRKGDAYFFTGSTAAYKNSVTLNSPDFEPVRDQQLHANRIIPIYPLTHGVSHKWLRHKIYLILGSLRLDEILPTQTHQQTKTVSQDQAYHHIHFPPSQHDLSAAQKRLALNDLLAIYLKSAITKNNWQSHLSTQITIDNSLHQKLLKSLNFSLTTDQVKTINSIFSDLNRDIPMNRLVQGDVGSGKTIVALSAALQVNNNNLTTLILAPTQVLAEQHFKTFSKLLKPFSITPTLVTGQTKKKIQTTPMIIGTHALLHRPELLKDHQVGLVVVDEQHRFGVLQRSHFLANKNIPHTLTMSATPIPRTIALSLYGHLDISDIKTMPENRKPIKTWVVTENKRTSAYKWISEEIKKNNTQAFFICPLIEDSEHESLKNIKAATSEFDRLKQIYPELKIALLHGRMKAGEKEKILSDFKSKKYHILVSTPVIEVGIDIPNANIILIEAAQRFGLAQLHQLRGRVGRGAHQSYCLLFSSDEGRHSLYRLKLLEKHHNGLALAKLDLQIRGSGELFGTAQSGHIDTQFSSFWDQSLNRLAKQIAQDLTTDPQVANKILNKLNPNLAKTASPN